MLIDDASDDVADALSRASVAGQALVCLLCAKPDQKTASLARPARLLLILLHVLSRLDDWMID